MSAIKRRYKKRILDMVSIAPRGWEKEMETKRRREYKTAFITQHVLWTDGGELCIKAFTLFLCCALRRKRESICEAKCFYLSINALRKCWLI